MDKLTNKEIPERTGLSSMEDLLIRKNPRWTGHLMRMSTNRLPKQADSLLPLFSGHRKREHRFCISHFSVTSVSDVRCPGMNASYAKHVPGSDGAF